MLHLASCHEPFQQELCIIFRNLAVFFCDQLAKIFGTLFSPSLLRILQAPPAGRPCVGDQLLFEVLLEDSTLFSCCLLIR
jgi:hypothetical protein